MRPDEKIGPFVAVKLAIIYHAAYGPALLQQEFPTSCLSRSIPLSAIAFLLPLHPAHAESAESAGRGSGAADSAAAPAPTAEAAHKDHDSDIVVTGVRRNAGDVLGGISVLDQEDLTRQVRPSIGETLARQPGVSSTSFGPTASAPVLRGLSGDRVRVLTDGIGSLDLAPSGPDHAISINPLTAERIEVLRGPSALLFGSSAIGGVVNVIDARIPRPCPTARSALTPCQLRQRRQRALGQSVGRRAGRRPFRRPRRRQLFENRRPAHRRPFAFRRPCAARRSPAPTPTSARSPISRANCPIPRPHRRPRRRRRLCRRRPERRRLGHPPHQQISACRSATRSTPTIEAEAADHRRRADALRCPRRGAAGRLLQPGPRPRRIFELSP